MSDLPIKIKRQNRRSLMMRRTHYATEVFIPHWLNPNSHIVGRFIEDGITKLGELPPPPQRDILTPESEIRAMVRRWATVMNLSPARITLREMTRKWGSCSSKDNITLNKALQYIPPHLVEYVVVHELVHMLVFNHGPQFREVLSHYMPDWQTREQALQQVRL